MSKVLSLAAAVIVIALVGARSASAAELVSGTRRPLTGYLARWADHMHTYSVGRVILHADDSACPDSGACASSGEIWWDSGRFPRSDTTQFTFYHELGHVFDFAYLTDADHARLARWVNQDIGAYLTAWFTGDTWYQESQESLGEYFADQYANCAQHDVVNEDARICRYINKVGRAHHAVPPFFR